jgi:hypothetical protein
VNHMVAAGGQPTRSGGDVTVRGITSHALSSRIADQSADYYAFLAGWRSGKSYSCWTGE